MIKTHEYWMKKALELAETAETFGEVPVGAIVVKDDTIISSGYNLREKQNNAVAHAELIAIDKACEFLGSWRLENCILYVTLEPCPMCGGGIINSRIPTVVYGASDPKSGCFGSVLDFNTFPFNHKPEIISGILGEESAELLKNFFRRLRR